MRCVGKLVVCRSRKTKEPNGGSMGMIVKNQEGKGEKQRFGLLAGDK